MSIFKERARLIREQKLAAISASNNKLWKLIPEEGKPYRVSWLITLDDTLELATHFVSGAPSRLCNCMYDGEDDCEDCNQINKFGNPNNPSYTIPMIGYVHDLVGKKRTSAKGKEYDENPVKLIEIPAGKNQVNWDRIKEYHSEGLLLEDVWVIERGKEPSLADPRLLAKEGSFEVPAEIRELYSNMSAGEKLGNILVAYGNLKKNHKDFVSMGVVFPADPTTEKPKTDTVEDLDTDHLDEDDEDEDVDFD